MLFASFQDFGPKVNFKKKKVKTSVFSGLPGYSKPLVDKMINHTVLEDFIPVELCNLEYEPERGSAIDPHFDDAWLWGNRLVTINLLSDTNLMLSRDSTPEIQVAVPLPAKSLLVVSGEARYIWKHAIHHEDIRRRRLAMTFRELSSEFMPGGINEKLGQEIIDISLGYNGVAVGTDLNS